MSEVEAVHYQGFSLADISEISPVTGFLGIYPYKKVPAGTYQNSYNLLNFEEF
jgi:hypothetical protein